MSTPSLYADLSHYYDELCSNIDYREQCDFIIRANSICGNGGTKHLDLACGSGSLLRYFADAGFDCTGLDISADMLKHAAQRCPQAKWMCADMNNWSVPAPVDLITCFLYSMHYCPSIAAIEQTFARVFTALAPGGLFCFDAVDKEKIANDAGHTHTLTTPESDLNFQTRWHYAGAGDAMDLHVEIREIRDQQSFHYNERHSMTAVTIATLQQLLESAGFAVIVLEHDFTCIAQWRGQKGNVIFCATKEANQAALP